MKAPRTTIFLLCIITALSGFRSEVNAQDEPDLGWTYKAQVSTVWIGGNSESSSVGFRSTIKRLWESASWTTQGGFLRTESTIETTRAVGTVDSFVMEKETNRETTAENYFARTKVDKNLNARIHVLGGLDWLRNTFAGIDSRFLLASGAGITFRETKTLTAKADLAFTYTFEEEVVSNPFSAGNFPGLRAGYDVTYQATESTLLESELIGDWNLDDTDDVRADWTNALSVAINSSLALKPSILIRWRNEPALEEVSLFDSQGEDTGEIVVVPLEKTDWFLNLAIVLTL